MLVGTQRTFYVISLCISFICLLLASVQWYVQHAAVEQAAKELAACRRIAAEIESFRMAPKAAVLEQQTSQQISLAVQSAAQVAEIPDSEILEIRPRHGRRLEKSPYIEQPTEVPIRKATLGQLSRFLGELSAIDSGLKPVSITLKAPHAVSNSASNSASNAASNDARTEVTEFGFTEFWECDLVLTYLVFSPE